jgi:hypothetical protein
MFVSPLTGLRKSLSSACYKHLVPNGTNADGTSALPAKKVRAPARRCFPSKKVRSQQKLRHVAALQRTNVCPQRDESGFCQLHTAYRPLIFAAIASALRSDCQNCGVLIAETADASRVTVNAERTIS